MHHAGGKIAQPSLSPGVRLGFPVGERGEMQPFDELVHPARCIRPAHLIQPRLQHQVFTPRGDLLHAAFFVRRNRYAGGFHVAAARGRTRRPPRARWSAAKACTAFASTSSCRRRSDRASRTRHRRRSRGLRRARPPRHGRGRGRRSCADHASGSAAATARALSAVTARRSRARRSRAEALWRSSRPHPMRFAGAIPRIRRRSRSSNATSTYPVSAPATSSMKPSTLRS